MKKIILEFEDPYSGGQLNLRPVIRDGKPTESDPDRHDPAGVSEPDDPRPTPSRWEVGQQIDGPHINPNRIEAKVLTCLEDFKLNWGWYMSYAAWYAALAMPALLSAFAAMRVAGRGIAGTVGAVAEPKAKLDAAHESIKNKTDALSAKLKSMSEGPKNKVVSDALEALKKNDKKLKLSPDQLSKWGKVGKVGLYAGKASIVIGSWIVVASFLTYHGPEWFKKWANEAANPDANADYGAVQKSLAVLLQTAIISKTTLAHLALKMNNNFYERCIFSNMAITAVVGAILGSFLFRGKKTLHTVSEAEFKALIKNADDMEALVKAEAASRVKMFLDDFTSQATKVLDKYDDIPPATRAKYIKVFTEEGSEAAFQIIKNNPNAKVINDTCVGRFNEMEKVLRREHKALGDSVTGKYNDEARKVSQGQKQIDEIVDSLAAAAKRRKFDPRVTGDMQLAINSSKGKAFDDIRQSFLGANRAFKDDMLVDLSKGIKRIDELLETGQITTRQAIKGYKNGIDTNLAKFVDDLVGPQSNIARTDAQRVEHFIKTLKLLSQKDEHVETALRTLLPKGKNDVKINFVDKIFRTSKLKRKKDVLALKASQEAIDEAMISILKINSRMDPAQLKAIEKSIKKAQDQYFKVFREKYLGTAYNTVKERGSILAVRVFIAGVTTATVLNIIKYTLVRPPQLGTLESFKAENLAKSLAWDGWFPNPLEYEAYENAITYWVELVLGNLRNTEANRTKYPDRAAGSVPSTILMTFIFKYNGPGFLKPLVDSGMFDSSTDFNEQTIDKIMEAFIEYKVGSGKNDQKFLRAIREEMAYDQSPDNNPGIGEKSAKSNIVKYFKERYRPIIGAIMCLNCGMIEILESLKEDNYFWTLKRYAPEPGQPKIGSRDLGKYGYLYKKLFGWNRKRRTLAIDSLERFDKEWKDELNRSRPEMAKKLKEGKIIMNNKQLTSIIRQVMKENYGQGYSDYPYNSEIGNSEEEQQDFIQDWKDFELSLVRDESRDMAVAIAKILVKDLELFADVLDLVGKNQSVATEILRKYKENEDSSKES